MWMASWQGKMGSRGGFFKMKKVADMCVLLRSIQRKERKRGLQIGGEVSEQCPESWGGEASGAEGRALGGRRGKQVVEVGRWTEVALASAR